MATNPESRVLLVREVAVILNAQPALVREMIQRGELPALRLGRRGDYRIPRDAVDALLASARTQAQ